jgi:hypothetical protein
LQSTKFVDRHVAECHFEALIERRPLARTQLIVVTDSRDARI